MEDIDLANLEITADPEHVDEDRFVSLWNVASDTMGKDPVQARWLASKFLGFLCKKRWTYVLASPNDAKYLDDWYERDNSLLNDWTPESEKVDVLAQHAYVPLELFKSFLITNKFKPETKYSPRRSLRVEWFTEDWKVG